MQAELDLKRGKVDDAIIALGDMPSRMHGTKRERVRWAFILAQLYQLKGKEEKAIKQFAAVVQDEPALRNGVPCADLPSTRLQQGG